MGGNPYNKNKSNKFKWQIIQIRKGHPFMIYSNINL